MMSPKLSRRAEECQNLLDFTKQIDQDILDIVSTLGWSVESIKSDNDNNLVCPYDSSHRISKDSLDRHLESCQWRKEGYNESSVPLPEPSLPLTSPALIKLDATLQNFILQEAKKKDPTLNIEDYEYPTWHKFYLLSKHEFLTLIIGQGERLIPQTSDRIFSDFTRDERKALYEYAVANTVKADIGCDITDTHKPKSNNKEDKKLTFLELLVQERNLKRRRAKHKGVHTNKKSHTEIIREVINQQMEEYVEYMNENQGASCDKNPENISETRYPNKDFDNSQPLPQQFNAPISKRRHYPLEDSHDYRGSYKHRHNQKYERYDKSSGYYDESCDDYDKSFNYYDKDKRAKYSRSTSESRKSHKSHKRKRSHSRERDHSKRKHSSSRHSHKRDSERYDSEKSSSSHRHLKKKKKKDHREDREDRERLEL